MNHLRQMEQVIQHIFLIDIVLYSTAVGKYARRLLNHAARELSLKALARRIVLAEVKVQNGNTKVRRTIHLIL